MDKYYTKMAMMYIHVYTNVFKIVKLKAYHSLKSLDDKYSVAELMYNIVKINVNRFTSCLLFKSAPAWL